jgi:dihydrofolate reductase
MRTPETARRGSALRLDMSVSLDGYVVGPQDSPDDPMGLGGFRLFNWLDHRFDPGPNGEVVGELNATRAVISGRRTYEHAGHWQGDHHDGVPVFVLTHHVPDEPPPGSVRYVTDVHDCAAQARAAAGDADVLVMGAGAAQSLLRAGELDELELHVVPVLLGQGRRLFDQLPAGTTELELVRALTADETDPEHRVLHLRYRIVRPSATRASAEAGS